MKADDSLTELENFQLIHIKIDKLLALLMLTFIMLMSLFCFIAAVIIGFLRKSILQEKNTTLNALTTELGRCPQTSSKAASLYRTSYSKSKTSSSLESSSKLNKTNNPLCEMPDPKTLAKAPLATRLSATQLSNITVRAANETASAKELNHTSVCASPKIHNNEDDDSGICNSGLKLI